MPELFAPINLSSNPDTYLDAALTDDADEISVRDAGAMPGVDQVSIVGIGDEVVKIIGAASGPWEIERGLDGTTAAEHDDGVAIYHVAAPTALRALAEEFAIPGPQGATGATGAQGPTGAQGAAGPDDQLVGAEVPEFTSASDDDKGLIWRAGAWVKELLGQLANANTWTETNTFMSFTKLFRTSRPTTTIMNFESPGATNCAADSPIGQAYVNTDASFGDDKPFYCRDLNTNHIFRVIGGGAQFTQLSRGLFRTSDAQIDSGAVLEIQQTDAYAVVLEPGSEERASVNLTGPCVIEFKLPNPDDYAPGEIPDGMKIFRSDAFGMLGSGGAIIMTDINGSQAIITERHGSVEATFDETSGQWSFLIGSSETEEPASVADVALRVCAAGPLPNSPTYSDGVLTSTSPAQPIVDGVTLQNGDTFLAPLQADPTHNGVYRVTNSVGGTNWVAVRHEKFAESSELVPGMQFTIAEGNTNADSEWILTTNKPITVGTTALNFKQINNRDIRFDFSADVGTPASLTETDLYSSTLTAGLLRANGDKIVASYGGIFANNATTKRLRIRFNTTVIGDTGVLTGAAAGHWSVSVELIRVSSTVLRCTVTFLVNGVTVTAPIVTYTEITGLTFTTTRILKLTGQNGTANANDIVAKMGYVEYVRAA